MLGYSSHRPGWMSLADRATGEISTTFNLLGFVVLKSDVYEVNMYVHIFVYMHDVYVICMNIYA